jgi:hypothetical protein
MVQFDDLQLQLFIDEHRGYDYDLHSEHLIDRYNLLLCGGL